MVDKYCTLLKNRVYLKRSHRYADGFFLSNQVSRSNSRQNTPPSEEQPCSDGLVRSPACLFRSPPFHHETPSLVTRCSSAVSMPLMDEGVESQWLFFPFSWSRAVTTSER
jgi:hypothetical protein